MSGILLFLTRVQSAGQSPSYRGRLVINIQNRFTEKIISTAIRGILSADKLSHILFASLTV